MLKREGGEKGGIIGVSLKLPIPIFAWGYEG